MTSLILCRVAGRAVQWLRDSLGIIKSAPEVETLAKSVGGSAGVSFVPAFTGLFAPYWRDDARGCIFGMTLYSTKAHIAYATLEAVSFQVREVLDAMEADSGINLSLLKVDVSKRASSTQNEPLELWQPALLSHCSAHSTQRARQQRGQPVSACLGV